MFGKKMTRWVALGICAVMLLGVGFHASAEEEQAAKQTKYKIYVNRAANCVTAVTTNERGEEQPVRAMACSCGRAGHETPTGTFTTSDYYEWRLMVDRTYGRYAVRFNNRILFHSVPYTAPASNKLEWDEYNLLGESASLGCVRLCVADAKWIYDNCEQGTTVVVYDDAENPGPLGKPGTADISGGSSNRNWDPTDPDPVNPWRKGLSNWEIYDTFEAESYAARYPDVKAAYGTNKALLWMHFITHGKKEGRTPFVLPEGQSYEAFDAVGYADRYPDVKALFGTDKDLLWTHYIVHGRGEGRSAF